MSFSSFSSRVSGDPVHANVERGGRKSTGRRPDRPESAADLSEALPIRWFGGKSDILEASGWSAERALTTLDANKPVVVMWFGPMPPGFAEWLAANYTDMGLYDPNHLGYAQQIYVLNGREDVMATMKNWPLEK